MYKSLLEVGVPVIIVDTLCNWYSKLFYAVRWNGKLFAHFAVCSGVDRAAVSHLLFLMFLLMFYYAVKASRNWLLYFVYVSRLYTVCR